ncbi:hypothetical protein CPU12_02510 [Malaciobacter molluscorum LMG 25693]|uniref:Membrane protein n=1 Tax=Malaciobacter molluscorum LMG 25693 TaxID=870501 RepID=A0A2G1DKU1_9BACT|nr:putative membrane protein [Malaciobacter molluscorum LMG 25693]PHO19135.1 hypothetical protein CPU12_02510 [Malaciobacter molluscorum LMG 25693]
MSKSIKIIIFLSSISLLHFIFMLIFRAFIYMKMYKAPQDPYGISDIIELILYIIFLILLFISFLVSIFLLIKGNNKTRKASFYLIVFSVSLYYLFSPLHHYAARISY